MLAVPGPGVWRTGDRARLGGRVFGVQMIIARHGRLYARLTGGLLVDCAELHDPPGVHPDQMLLPPPGA